MGLSSKIIRYIMYVCSQSIWSFCEGSFQ